MLEKKEDGNKFRFFFSSTESQLGHVCVRLEFHSEEEAEKNIQVHIIYQLELAKLFTRFKRLYRWVRFYLYG